MSKNLNLPDDWRERLAPTKKAAVTPRDMLKLLDSIPNYVGSLLNAGVNRTIYNTIVKTIRAQKDSAPARTGAPSNPNSSGEAGSSIAASMLECKIELEHGDSFSIQPVTGAVNIHWDIPNLDLEMIGNLTPDEARQLAAVLLEAAGDVDRDGAVREHYAKLLAATTE